MKKEIIVFKDPKVIENEMENLVKHNFIPIFVSHKEELFTKIKEMDNAFVVGLLCEGEEFFPDLRELMIELKAMEEMKNKSIFVIFENQDLIHIEDFRSQDDFVVKPYYEKIVYKRLTNMYEILRRNKAQKDEIDDLLIMNETLTNLVSTIFYLIIPKIERHCVEVGKYTKYIGELYHKQYPEKLSERDVSILSNLVFLHDIGLIYVNRNVVYANRELNYEEQLELRKHPLIGGQLFRMVRQTIYEKYGRTTSFIEKAIEITEYHHELSDGAGYPFGLIGENIPLFAKLIIFGEYLSNAITSPLEVKVALNNLLDSESEKPKYDQDIAKLINANIEGFMAIALELEELE